MLSYLIPLLFVQQGVPPSQEPKQQPMYNRVIARTTGMNGYEEYVRAADMVLEPGLRRRLVAAFNSPQPGVVPASYLQSRRDLMTTGSKVLEMVRAGNRKAVFDPR